MLNVVFKNRFHSHFQLTLHTTECSQIRVQIPICVPQLNIGRSELRNELEMSTLTFTEFAKITSSSKKFVTQFDSNLPTNVLNMERS